MNEPQQGSCISCGAYVDNEGNCTNLIDPPHESEHRPCEYCLGRGICDGETCHYCMGEGSVLHKSLKPDVLPPDECSNVPA
jgi:DnaJ-class molecular chaperone